MNSVVPQKPHIFVQHNWNFLKLTMLLDLELSWKTIRFKKCATSFDSWASTMTTSVSDPGLLMLEGSTVGSKIYSSAERISTTQGTFPVSWATPSRTDFVDWISGIMLLCFSISSIFFMDFKVWSVEASQIHRFMNFMCNVRCFCHCRVSMSFLFRRKLFSFCRPRSFCETSSFCDIVNESTKCLEHKFSSLRVEEKTPNWIMFTKWYYSLMSYISILACLYNWVNFC